MASCVGLAEKLSLRIVPNRISLPWSVGSQSGEQVRVTVRNPAAETRLSAVG